MTPVFIPYRESDEHRRVAFEHVTEWWTRHGYQVTVGDTSGAFNRSAARNRAAAGDWTVGVFADADTVGHPNLVAKAVRFAIPGRIVYPFTRYRGLTPAATARYLETGRVGSGKRKSNSPGGIFAINRDLYERVGGFDEGFTGWGYEDTAFNLATSTLGVSKRLNGWIIHLWHPRAADRDLRSAAYAANRDRVNQYRAVAGDPEAMTALIGELRGHA